LLALANFSAAEITDTVTTDWPWTGGGSKTAKRADLVLSARLVFRSVNTSIRANFPWLRHAFAEGSYPGEKPEAALKENGKWTHEIIKRSDTAKGFVLLPRRWVVKCTFA